MVTETDIANKGLQHCGASRIAANALWTEDSRNAAEMRTAYQIARRSELRRNVWRYSIRTQVLRPLDTTTRRVTYPPWSALVSYAVNEVVRGSDGLYWSAAVAGMGVDPTLRGFTNWTSFFGDEIANLYDATVTYMAGELVYSGSNIYLSLINNNTGNLLTVTTAWLRLTAVAWNSGSTYDLGDRVVFSSISYVSLQAGNINHSPDINPTWWTPVPNIDPVLSTNAIIYPIGAGPSSSTGVRNIYQFPYGYVRIAPQAPKQGSYRVLGAPSALPYSDWQPESNYFTSQLTGPVALRFAADIADPNLMDPMFVDGFACRLAFELCEILTQSTAKLNSLGGSYNKFMSEARIVNGIETGPTEAPEDSYIASRY